MTTHNPYSKERFDYLAPWEEDWYDESNPLMPHEQGDEDAQQEPEFVLDIPEYWDNYRDAVMNLTNQIICGARPAKDEPK